MEAVSGHFAFTPIRLLISTRRKHNQSAT